MIFPARRVTRPGRGRRGYGGGAAGDVQPAVDVFQVSSDGAFGQAEPPGDLGVGMPGGEQVKQLPVRGGEHRDGMTAAFGVEVGRAQMRAQQGEQVAVGLGEVTARPAEQEQPQGAAGNLAGARGQGQHELVLDALRPVQVAVHAGAVPLTGRVEVRDRDDRAQVPGPVGVAAGQAVSSLRRDVGSPCAGRSVR
jgi:hypothetical protein